MIRKVALVQALREAFPTSLAGMYEEGEARVVAEVEEEERPVEEKPVEKPVEEKEIEPKAERPVVKPVVEKEIAPEEKILKDLRQKVHMTKNRVGMSDETLDSIIKKVSQGATTSTKDLSKEQLNEVLNEIDAWVDEREREKKKEEEEAKQLGFANPREQRNFRLRAYDFVKRSFGKELSDNEVTELPILEMGKTAKELTKDEFIEFQNRLNRRADLLNKFYASLGTKDLTDFLKERGIERRPELLSLDKLEELVESLGEQPAEEQKLLF